MYYWLIPLCIGIVLLGVFLYFRVKEKRFIAVIVKGLASLMFILTALVAWLCSKNPDHLFGVFVLLGLSFGLLGDVFLDIKFMDKKREFLFTSLGFISFGIGHIFFISGLFVNFFDFSANVLYIVIPLIVTLILVAVVILMEKVSPIRYGNMKPFAIVYGFVLFACVTLYMSTSIQSGWKNATVAVMAVSLISFALSDLILNKTYFAPNCTGPAYIISNHVIYYIAQFGIAISLFFLS